MLSIVIPTLNRPESLKRCVENIRDYVVKKNDKVEVIVVDSSANDDSKKAIQEFSFVKYVRSSIKNISVQRNLGVIKSLGEIIVFLDDDSFVFDSWVDRVIEDFRNSEIDILGGLVIDKDQEISEFHGTEIIGHVFPSGLTIANFGTRASRILEVDWVQGCNMAFRRSIFKKIHGFDLLFKGIYEETELCVRAKLNGFKVFFDSDLIVDHVRAKKATLERGRKRFRGRYFASRNYTYFLIKNFPFDARKLFFIYLKETWWQVAYFLRKPKLYNFGGIFANIFGKIVGTWLVFRYYFFIKRNEEPLLKV